VVLEYVVGTSLKAAHAIGLLHLNLSASHLRICQSGSPQDDWTAVEALEHELRSAAV
jgi:hypothetical protein